MKKLTILAVTATALMLAAGKVEASVTNLILNVSGIVQYQFTNSYSTNAIVGKTKTESFNNATIYNLISNAVANAGSGLAATLPAKGIIEFDPSDSDGTNGGFFYVTDQAKDFYYKLSGFNASHVYYSFMELDSWVITEDESYMEFGFGYPFDGSASYNLNASRNGSLSGKATALLYIHDGPYYYDAADSPQVFYSNNQAYEIQGIMTVQLTYKTNSVTDGTLSLTGTGNALLTGVSEPDDCSVTSGHASLAQ